MRFEAKSFFFFFKNMHIQMLSASCLPFFSGLYVLWFKNKFLFHVGGLSLFPCYKPDACWDNGWYRWKYGDGYRVDSRLAPSQWETLLQCNGVSHWLGANLESALWLSWLLHAGSSSSWIVKLFIMSYYFLCCWTFFRADSRLAPSQQETALLCNDVSHWLGTNLESTLFL